MIIMKKNYFEVKAAMKAVNANIRKAHPDWDNKRVYAVTRAIVLKNITDTSERIMVTNMTELKNNEINFEFYGDTYRLSLYKTTYRDNNNLAIVVMDEDNQEQFAILTVNIIELPDNNMAAIDTNNCKDLAVALQDAGFFTYLGISIPSGFCTYPVGIFDLDRIPDMPTM